jgi:hypothetical protein
MSGLKDLRAMPKSDSCLWKLVTEHFAQAGELDKAMEWLNKEFEKREGCLLPVLNVHQGFRNLHGDPRFSALLLRMGLPE